jgi:Mrp family chromosome partitioning ATPase
MEKIQSAIAKARAARTSEPAAPPQSRVRPDGPNGPSGPDSAAQAAQAGRVAAAGPVHATDVDAAWAALPTFDPSPKWLQSGRIVAITKGRAATEFDKLRTRMLQRMQAQGWRRVAITSPGPGSGKSTMALNLGFSMARQMSMRTMICEMDLRRPTLARLLGAPRDYDFARVIGGSAAFADHAVRPRENLAVAMSHGFVERSAELLQGPGIAAVLDRLQADYDPTMMMFDMPPFEVSDDTLAFVDKVDCVLIVAASGSTTAAQIDVCERELASRTAVLGVVLNKCRYGGDENGAYDYYG